MEKPNHQSKYQPESTQLCERALVTLLRGLGPWKSSCTLAGGLVPRYLVDAPEHSPHVGTSDVDLILDFQIIQDIEAYRRLEQNLKDLNFKREISDEGTPRHFRWIHNEHGLFLIVDLLCSTDDAGAGLAHKVPKERRLSALGIPGAHLAINDWVPIEITAELLGERGVATETVRVAGLAPFIIMKALAYEDRMAEKDAYDLIFSLLHIGPQKAGQEFASRAADNPGEALYSKALEILRSRFANGSSIPGFRKDGPTSYARFLATDSPQLTEQNRRLANATIEDFLRGVEAFG